VPLARGGILLAVEFHMGDAMSKRHIITLAVLAALCGAGTAQAADLQKAPVYTKAPPPMAPAFTWTGFYIGLNAGGKWASVDQQITSGATVFTLNDNNASSWIAGGQIGYNWQVGQWVFGVEGDVDAHDFNRSRVVAAPVGPFIAGDTFTVESKWQASLRGRIGYAFDRALLYATGGVAWAQRKNTVTLVGIGTATNDDTVTGGTIGGGLEYAIWNNVSIGVEGRWSFYGDQTISGTIGGIPVSDRVSLDTAEVMGKLNFRF
jgi:outer membrane immunogenic protein